VSTLALLLILFVGLACGTALAGGLFLTWYFYVRIRNMRNAIMEFTKLLLRQEERYTAMTTNIRALETSLAEFRTEIRGTSVETDPVLLGSSSLPEYMPPDQSHLVRDAISAWQHIMNEDERPEDNLRSSGQIPVR
jgi:hypothetical protein